MTDMSSYEDRFSDLILENVKCVVGGDSGGFGFTCIIGKDAVISFAGTDPTCFNDLMADLTCVFKTRLSTDKKMNR
eukprot:UN18077